MEEKYFKHITTTFILAVLIVLSFLLLKPILMSIIIGVILAFMFSPLYNFLSKFIKSKNLVATLLVLFLILLIFLPVWFLTPIILDQSIKFYLASQQIDFVTPLQNIFPSLFASEQFSAEIGSIIYSFVVNIADVLVNSFSKLILNFPTIFLQLLVVFFTFFFVLRDNESLVNYVKSLLPFSKDVIKKLFDSSRGLTASIIYGQVVIGMAQGILVGIGFFLFGVSNALLLTFLAIIAGIFPIIGTTIIWLPVAIYLFLAGNSFQAFGIVFFGIISSSIDNLIRPVFISRRTNLNSSVILVGMIGGLFMFGILGIILGPLILAYLLIILEIYRNKENQNIFIQKPKRTR